VVSHTDIERKKLIEVLNCLEFVDSTRHLVPMDQKVYTWWSYRTIDWQQFDRGRRLDHIWVSSNMQDRLEAFTSMREARSWEQPSDHVPYIVDLDG
jgi:exodeoxyribonuclease-3